MNLPQPATVGHNLLSMRDRPDDSSEMVSQALFGHPVTILEEDGDYARVQTLLDGYEGWALARHLVPCDRSDRLDCATATVWSTFAIVYATPDFGTVLSKLSLGSILEAQSEDEIVKVNIDGATGFVKSSDLIAASNLPSPSATSVLHVAHALLGTPYVWGGVSAFGCDCSGFVQRVFSQHGIWLPRDAYQQAAHTSGVRTKTDETPEAGEIVFFCGLSDRRNRGITHVGIALDDRRFIHASGNDGVIINRFLDDDILSRYVRKGGLRICSG